jgi:hypothetical protein
VTAIERADAALAVIRQIETDVLRVAREAEMALWDIRHGAAYDAATARAITRRCAA